MVVAHGERPWTAPTSLIELFDADEDLLSVLSPVLVSFQFLLEDLTSRPSAALRDREGFTALARFTLLLLQRGRVAEDLLEELRSWIDVFREVGAGPAGREDIVSVLAYTWIVGGVPPTALRALLRDDPRLNVDEVMGAAEKFIAQIGPPTWLQRGRAEGEAKGRAERGAELLLRQLSRRFGVVPGPAAAAVRAASVEELDAMADRVLDAGTLDEVLGR